MSRLILVEMEGSYKLKRPDALHTLANVRYFETEYARLDVIQICSPSGWVHGSPDYLLGEWLIKRWLSDAGK
jgi:hypothetical protein